MYIEAPRRSCTRDGEQRTGSARFLILVQKEGSKEIRALVRKVALRQLGHFMMGTAKAFGTEITISGSYGSDGLPTTVHADVFEHAVPLPDELRKAWDEGGGHNSAGSEAPAMREWALANLEALESQKAWKPKKHKLSSTVHEIRECTVTEVPVALPNLMGETRPGDFISWMERGRRMVGRVLGRVDAPEQHYAKEGLIPPVKRHLFVLALSDDWRQLYVRWIDPADVTQCTSPPANLMRWFLQPELPDPGTVLRMERYGTLCESYIADPKGGPDGLREDDADHRTRVFGWEGSR